MGWKLSDWCGRNCCGGEKFCGGVKFGNCSEDAGAIPDVILEVGCKGKNGFGSKEGLPPCPLLKGPGPDVFTKRVLLRALGKARAGAAAAYWQLKQGRRAARTLIA